MNGVDYSRDVEEVFLELQRDTRDPDSLEIFLSTDRFLTPDKHRLIMGKKTLKKLEVYFRIFPWIVYDTRIRNSGLDERELISAMFYFCRPFNKVESRMIVSYITSDEIASMGSKEMSKLRAIVALKDLCERNRIVGYQRGRYPSLTYSFATDSADNSMCGLEMD